MPTCLQCETSCDCERDPILTRPLNARNATSIGAHLRTPHRHPGRCSDRLRSTPACCDAGSQVHAQLPNPTRPCSGRTSGHGSSKRASRQRSTSSIRRRRRRGWCPVTRHKALTLLRRHPVTRVDPPAAPPKAFVRGAARSPWLPVLVALLRCTKPARYLHER